MSLTIAVTWSRLRQRLCGWSIDTGSDPSLRQVAGNRTAAEPGDADNSETDLCFTS